MREQTIWGIDPSTKRIALAVLKAGGGHLTSVLELGPSAVDARKLAHARRLMVDWFDDEHDVLPPDWVWLETPGGANVPWQSVAMLGVVMEAVYAATNMYANLIPPARWKKEAGIGGAATKGKILEWAQARGFTGTCDRCPPDGKCKDRGPVHDMADALGVAAAGEAFLERQR